MNHVTRVLAIRHGETAWNVDSRIQGHTDIPLNDTGLRQAEQLAAALADDGVQAIYASDLQRAWQTAQAIGRVTGLPVRAEPGLRERAFGAFEGSTYQEISAKWPDAAERWRRRDLDFRPGDSGESLRMLYERCVSAATRIAAAHPGETIVMVAHGGVMDCLYRAATRVGLEAPRSWQLGNASINRLLFSEEGFTLVGWSDTSHLDGGGLDEIQDRVGHAA